MTIFTAAGRSMLYMGVSFAMTLSLLPVSALNSLAQENCRKLNGFDLCGRFLQEWSRQGSEQNSLYVNGLPITARRPEISLTDGQTYEVQWFERARYEAHPQNKPPYDVLLGLLGANLVEGRGSVDPSTGMAQTPADLPFVGVDRPSDADGRRKVWFPETKHSVSGKILEYWSKYGGVKQFGFPLSEPFEEVSQVDGKPYTVQYFERNRFELHPEKAAPYDVELGLLGVEQYGQAPIPADQLPIAPPKSVASTKGELIVALSQFPASLLPVAPLGYLNNSAVRPLFSRVVGQDADGNLYPELVSYVPTLENGGAHYRGSGDHRYLVVKYKLHRGIKWSDGTEVTARDLLYYYTLYQDGRLGAISYSWPLLKKVHRVAAPDRYTVLVNFMSYAQVADVYARAADKKPDAYLKPFFDEKRPATDPFYNLALEALPEHVLGKIPVDKIEASDYGRQPVGNGPFMVQNKNWRESKEIVLVPNPHYNLTAGPLLQKIVFRHLPYDIQVSEALKKGEIDAAPDYRVPGGLSSPSITSDSLKGTGLKLDSALSSRWVRIDFNLDRPFFKEKAVRQAIAHAINRQRIVDQILLGRATVAHTFLSPTTWASMQNSEFAKAWEARFPLKKYEYDVDRANKMLDGAGWVKGSDGIRVKNGIRLRFDYGAYTVLDAEKMIASDLKAVGIETKFARMPDLSFCDMDCSYMYARRFDFGQYVSLPGFDPADPNREAETYHSSQVPSAQNTAFGKNFSGYSNPRFDALWQQTEREIARSKRAPLLAEMQSIWSDDLPAVPLYIVPDAQIYRETLVNWEVSGIGVPATYRAATLYFR